MASDLKQLQRKVFLAQSKLMHKEFCFFGCLSLWLKYRIDDSIETAATNGSEIIFNSEFLDKMNMGELKWVMAHEIMHIALGHIRRKGTRDHMVFNYASDFAIHSILKEFEADTFKMPEGCLYDKKYDGMCSEAIYNDIAQQISEGKGKAMKTLDDHGQWGKDPAKGQGDPDDKDGEGCEMGEVSEDEWKQRMEDAAKMASGKMEGKTPSFLKDLLANLQPPKKDWRQLLSEFIQPEVADYSFNPPDKRLYSMSECLLPDFNDEEETVKNIAFFIDISGSMSEQDISDAYSEIVGAINQFGSMSGYLGYFDTAIHNFEKFEDVKDVIKNKPHSGGGTDFEACFRFLKDTDVVDMQGIVGIVILSDGECGFGNSYKLSEGIPTLFLFTDDHIPKAPFGTTSYLRYRKSLNSH